MNRWETTEHWERKARGTRRARKQLKEKNRMRVQGMAYKKVILPLIARKAEEARKRASDDTDRPLRSSTTSE